MAQRTSRSRGPKGNKGFKGNKGAGEDFKKGKDPASRPRNENLKRDRDSAPKSNREEFRKDREPGQRPTREEFRRDRRQDRRQEEEIETVSNELMIIGRNAILEALNADRTIDKLFVQTGSNEGSIRKIIAEAKDKGIVIQDTEKIRLDTMAESGKHQGVIAFASAHDYVRLEDILAAAEAKGEDPFIIIMENLNDPHNLGAVIRSANAAGAHGVVIPKRRSVGLTSVVGKVSAGAIEYTPVAKVTNIVRTIETLKSQGVWVACADMSGDVMYETDLKGPIALVVGGEGEGVSRLVKENCDYVVSMPMKGQIDSLNASVAAALLMYEVVRQRRY